MPHCQSLCQHCQSQVAHTECLGLSEEWHLSCGHIANSSLLCTISVESANKSAWESSLVEIICAFSIHKQLYVYNTFSSILRLMLQLHIKACNRRYCITRLSHHRCFTECGCTSCAFSLLCYFLCKCDRLYLRAQCFIFLRCSTPEISCK